MNWGMMDEKESLRRLQNEELSILLVLDEFCKDHGISYFMASGTALGALRHGGFIPWDDDIDVAMLRPDYDRFIELAEASLPAGYSLHTAENTPGFAGTFAKLYKDGTVFQTAETLEAGCAQAIFIDVFPYDRISENKGELKEQISNAKKWQRISYLYHSKSITVPHKGLLGAIERRACVAAHYLVRAFLKPDRIIANFNRSINRSSGFDPASARYVQLSAPYVIPVAESVLYPPVHVPFEGHLLPVPAKCDEYLTTWYGNWHELPSPDNRHTHLPQRLVFSDGTSWESE